MSVPDSKYSRGETIMDSKLFNVLQCIERKSKRNFNPLCEEKDIVDATNSRRVTYLEYPHSSEFTDNELY